MGPDEGVSDEQRLSAYNEAKANILSVPDIADQLEEGRSDREVRPVRKCQRADRVFIGEIARVWLVTAP
jgi:hypothetical protein